MAELKVRVISAVNPESLEKKLNEFFYANDLNLDEFKIQVTWRDAQQVTATVVFR